MFGSIREQSHLTGLLDRGAQTALVLGTSASFAARFDLPTIRNVSFQETISIFIVNFAHMIVTKLTYFAA